MSQFDKFKIIESKMKIGEGGYKQQPNQNDLERARLKTSPAANYPDKKHTKDTAQTVLPFHYDQYPFLNTTNTQITALKTTVNFTLTAHTLQRLVSINHPNVIAIRKIIRNSPKESNPTSGQLHYAFFYEAVHFSIRYLFQNPSEHPRLYNLLMTTNLRSVLNSLMGYLQSAQIFVPLDVENIGISLEGNIKIYIPISGIFASQFSTKLQKSIQRIADWWEDCQQSLKRNNFKKEKKILQLQPPKLSHNDELGLDETSVRDSTLERELEDLLGDDDDDEDQHEPSLTQTKLKASTNSISRVGSIQLEKINRINEELKCIREKINEKKSKPPSTIIEPDHQNNLQQVPVFQEAPQPESKGYFRMTQPEPIQQNIHCINIYNHNSHLPPTRYQTLPTFIQQPQMIQNNYQPYDPEIYGYYEDNYSQDTYDVEFQNSFEPTGANLARNSTPFRHTIFTPGNRDLSVFHLNLKGQMDKEGTGRDKVNQVCNKNYTESAGPLQFKGFFSKFIKGQTDTIEEEHSQPGKCNKTITSGYGSKNNRGSLSMEKGLTQKQSKGRIECSQEMDKAANIKRIYSQNIFAGSTRLNAGECGQQIEERVKKALEKTKNAIALLNKVKQNKNLKVISMQ